MASSSSSLRSKRATISITSYFCNPDLGMKDFEVLCKASVFLVKSDQAITKFPHKYHFVTVSHVTAPWKWPKLYQEEYLQYVNEKHTVHTVEVRYDDGIFMTQLDLYPKVYHHPTKDLCVLHLAHEERNMKMLRSLEVEENNELLNHDKLQYVLNSGKTLYFHGHDVIPAPEVEEPFTGELSFLNEAREEFKKTSGPYEHLQDDPKVIPTFMEGTIMGRTLHQIFVKTTPSTLPNGMCGGPVLIPHQDIQIPINEDNNNNNNNNNNNRNHSSSSKKIEQYTSSGSSNGIGYSESSNCSTATTTTTTTTTTTNVSGKKKRQAVNVSKLSSYDGMEGNIRTPLAICGMIEGIVPVDHPVEEIRGAAVFIESSDIATFLHDIEIGKIQPVEGGDSIIDVVRDFDPSKSDMNNVWR